MGRSFNAHLFRGANRSMAEMSIDIEEPHTNPQDMHLKIRRTPRFKQSLVLLLAWILFDWGLGVLKTLIELMIMGGRIWKTDDSVSTRDFSFLSDISLPVLTGELHSTHTVVVFLDKPARLRFVKLNQNEYKYRDDNTV